jgi:hypothetical protein
VSVSDFEHDDIEPDAYGAMVLCSSLGFLHDREFRRRKTPGSSSEIIEDEDAYAQARITSSMAISYATMGFMWDCQAKTLMMFEVLPTGAWRFRRLVEADLTQPLVYVRRRYTVERVVTIKTGRSDLSRILCRRLFVRCAWRPWQCVMGDLRQTAQGCSCFLMPIQADGLNVERCRLFAVTMGQAEESG